MVQELSRPSPFVAFGDIRRDGHRRPLKLGYQPMPFVGWKALGELVAFDGEPDRLLPDFEVLVASNRHGVP